mmetsp:Transcript_57860/g.167845  ORF Transcript_57860/g.167845 Transcript_57860/m.167845 type:complete len:253 (-) Transcript_57860:261-1019(-)
MTVACSKAFRRSSVSARSFCKTRATRARRRSSASTRRRLRSMLRSATSSMQPVCSLRYRATKGTVLPSSRSATAAATRRRSRPVDSATHLALSSATAERPPRASCACAAASSSRISPMSSSSLLSPIHTSSGPSSSSMLPSHLEAPCGSTLTCSTPGGAVSMRGLFAARARPSPSPSEAPHALPPQAPEWRSTAAGVSSPTSSTSRALGASVASDGALSVSIAGAGARTISTSLSEAPSAASNAPPAKVAKT